MKKTYYVKFTTMVETFGWDIEVVFTSGVNEYWNTLCSAPMPKAEAFHYQPDGEGKSILVFPWNTTHGFIAHEAYHAVVAMFRWADIKSWDEEIVAYHIQYVVDEVMQFAFERNKKNKKWIPKKLAKDK